VTPSLAQIAQALGGEVRAGQVRAPGPGHTPHDRSMTVKLSASAPDGFVVNSFAGNDAIECRDYVRAKLGMPAWQPNGGSNGHRTSPEKEMAEAIAGLRKAKRAAPGSEDHPPHVVATYSYVDVDGRLLYEVLRYEPKDFRQRRPVAGGGYTWSVGDVQRVLYRLPELLKFPDATVFFTEGEADSDRLASLDLTATTITASTTWTAELVEPLRGRDVIILADNDEAGAERAGKAAQALHDVAATLRLVLLPGLPDKGDVSDWLDAGHSKEQLEQVCLDAPIWQPQDEEPKDEEPLGEWDAGTDTADIPPRGWLLGNIFCRRFISSVIAEGGVGKSVLRLLQLLSLAIGRSLTGEHVFMRCRVLIVSLEDNADELRRRLRAACRHHGVGQAELSGRLYLAAPGASGGKLVTLDPRGRPILDRLAGKLARTITKRGIDIVSLDPFVKAHAVEENNNSMIDEVVSVLANMAEQFDIAVDVPHHAAKGAPDPGNANRGRGASAMKDAGRLIYTLTSMSPEEGQAFRLSEVERRHLIRLDSAKVNITPHMGDAKWFRLVGVEIGNANDLYPHGDQVQTVEPWTPPDTYAGLSNLMINEILTVIDAGLPDGNRYTDAAKAFERAAWRVVVKHTATSEAAARKIIKVWTMSGLLIRKSYENPATRKVVNGFWVDRAKRP
jgi:AAA domain-containing protein